MNVCHVWDADYPWDVRVEKICDSLSAKHKVHLICRNSMRRPRAEIIKQFHVHRLPSLPKLLGRLNSFVGFPAFINPLWIWHIWNVSRKIKADLIIVRDLPLALAAIGVGRFLRIPVILDMAENYPAMIQDVWNQEGMSLLNAVVRNPSVIRVIERVVLRWCDHVVVVVEESRDRLLADGVPAEKISLVINTPTSARWGELPALPNGEIKRGVDDLIVVYLGLLERPRGVDTAIRALSFVRERLPGVRLFIVGSGRHEKEFRQLAGELHLDPYVTFFGWVDYSSAIRIIQEADIGLVPHYATSSWNTTVPNKLFDYMSMGKPVIVSNARPTERIVKEERCGLVFRAEDAHDLARAMLELAQPSMRAQMGQCGQEAVAVKYNWMVDERRLLEAVERTAGKKG